MNTSRTSGFVLLRRLTVGCLVVAVGGAAIPSARAQFEACEDTLSLRSPTDLRVTFERSPVTGNRLKWRSLSVSEAGCFRFEVPDRTRVRTNPQVTGSYKDIFDRSISFKAAAKLAGVVGDPTQDQIRFDIDGQPAFEAVPSLAGFLNLSNRGGIFRTSLRDGTAFQVNGPLDRAPSNEGRLPNHLAKTDVTAFGTWQSADGSQTVIYAGITEIPLVRSDDGGQSWYETAVGGVDPIARPVKFLAVSPANPDIVFLGTENLGLWRSDDGGATFQRADRTLTTANPAVSVLNYLRVGDGGSGTRDRLFMGLRGVGFFYSDDDGANWVQVTQLRVPAATGVFCDRDTVPRGEARITRVTSLAVSPNDPNRVYAGLSDWGVYRSSDGGITWSRANNGMVLCPDEAGNATGRAVSIDAILVLRQQTNDQDNVLVASATRGGFLSSNAGGTWGNFPLPLANVEEGVQTRVIRLLQDPDDDNKVYAVTPRLGLLQNGSLGSGNWDRWEATLPLLTDQLSAAVYVPGGDLAQRGELLVGTSGAGVYLAGTDIELRRATIGTLPPDPTTNNQPRRVSVDLGLFVRFNAGPVDSTDRFEVFGQLIQGYAVWRADRFDFGTGEPFWQMIGLYDLTNPEFCFNDPCDALNPTRITGCFADKRANCFKFHDDGTVTFFDRNVQNGFTYRYAVSTFDYGFGGNTSPTSFRGEMLFSPRSATESSDQARPFTGERLREADLALTASALDLNPGPSGRTDLTYTLTNLGTIRTDAVRVSLPQPEGGTFDYAAAVPSAGQLDGTEWVLNALAVGESQTLVIPVTVGVTGLVQTEARIVRSGEFDPDPNNNVARRTLASETVDMSVALRSDLAVQTVGKRVLLTVDVTNQGSVPSTGAVLQLAESPGLRFESLEGAEAYEDGLAQMGSFAPGATKTVTVSAVVLRSGPGPVSVSFASADQADDNPANDRARIQVTGLNYNSLEFQVNVDVGDDLDGVFVVPNPLRGFAGFDRRGGSSVRFVNVTRDARCEIYTISGDRVRSLSNVVTDGEQRGNIQWDTKNEAGEDVASGVYIYRITDAAGAEVIGRFTIIR